MLSIPGLEIEVARECSSIRSSLMLFVTAMVLAHLFLRSWWRKALVAAAVIPLSVAKNGLRIFTIVELFEREWPRGSSRGSSIIMEGFSSSVSR
jgi:exosortase/archaeosortase family protein